MKAILVIDIPDNAKAEDYAIDRIWKYIPEEDDEMPIPIEKTFKRFRPMPEKVFEGLGISQTYQGGVVDGWNTCIDEILGESDESNSDS